MVLPLLAARAATAGKASAQAEKISSLQQETLRRAAELNSARKRAQEREQSQHGYAARAAERKLRQKMTGKAITLLTGGMGLPLGFFGGRIIGTLAKGMDLGISDIFKLVFLVLGLIVLSPLLIILFLPLSPIIFAFSLVGMVALFAKR